MQAFISQVRASIRYIVTGALSLVGGWLWAGNSLDSQSFELAQTSEALAIAAFVAVAFLLGHPIARLSTRLIEWVSRLPNQTKGRQSEHEALLKMLENELPLRENQSVEQFLCDQFGIQDVSPGSIGRVSYWCKQSVWHSGSPLWTYLNEREQLISVGRDTWLPLVFLLSGVCNFLAATDQLSIGIVLGLLTALALATYQAFFRQLVTRPLESRDILLSYLIVIGHPIKPIGLPEGSPQ